VIKFFRRIRKQLLSENRFSKYLLYAIGEIVLVVIGILIALQINNKNDQFKLDQTTQTYYKQILADFEKEGRSIDSLLVFLDNSISTYQRYKSTYKDSTKTSRDTYFALFGVQYVYPHIKFNTNTIQTLETTGEIKHMSPIIRDRLINLQRSYENLRDMSKTNNIHYLDALLRAGEFGLNDIARRLRYQDDLREQVEAEFNVAKMIIAADGAYRLKNFTELELKEDLTLRRQELIDLSELIKKELD